MSACHFKLKSGAYCGAWTEVLETRAKAPFVVVRVKRCANGHKTRTVEIPDRRQDPKRPSNRSRQADSIKAKRAATAGP